MRRGKGPAWRPARSRYGLASERGADLQARRMLQYVRTHSTDFVPCFVAFETNVRPYAVLAVMAMLSGPDSLCAKECRVGHTLF